jgi:hypothetical protein
VLLYATGRLERRVMMTRAEKNKMLKLEIENVELRKQNNKHMDVYRENICELIDLRAKNELVNQLLTDVLREVAL